MRRFIRARLVRPSAAEVRVGAVCCFAAAARVMRGLPCAGWAGGPPVPAGNSAQALLLTGDCYADLQQADRARHSYEDAARAAPDSGEVAFKLGRAYHDAGRRHDAIAQLDRAVKLGGDKIRWAPEAQLLLGDAPLEGHENEAAVKAYKRYLELAPPDAPARAEVQKHIATLGGG